MTRHSHQDAPSEPQFRRLLEATTELDYPYSMQCRWVLVAAGRLGLRAGEISHMREHWIDWQRSQINIPRHEPCSDGKNDSVCGYCRKRAEEAVEHNDDLSMETALAERWEPKTSNSARAIPFDFDEDVERLVEAFWRDRDRFPNSRASINRRVDRACEAAGIQTYPHALRACAATWHAYRGLPAPALQSLMGWAKLNTATKYIRLSGGATADALRAAHSD